MFRRVFYENWHAIVPIISFVLTFGVFLTATIRTLLTSREHVRHMEELPLDEPAKPQD